MNVAGLLSSPFVEQEPVNYVPMYWYLSKNMLCFVSSDYLLELLNWLLWFFFSFSRWEAVVIIYPICKNIKRHSKIRTYHCNKNKAFWEQSAANRPVYRQPYLLIRSLSGSSGTLCSVAVNCPLSNASSPVHPLGFGFVLLLLNTFIWVSSPEGRVNSQTFYSLPCPLLLLNEGYQQWLLPADYLK